MFFAINVKTVTVRNYFDIFGKIITWQIEIWFVKYYAFAFYALWMKRINVGKGIIYKKKVFFSIELRSNYGAFYSKIFPNLWTVIDVL